MQSRACFVSDHFLYSYYLNMRFRGDRWNGKLGHEGQEKKKLILKIYENAQ